MRSGAELRALPQVACITALFPLGGAVGRAVCG